MKGATITYPEVSSKWGCCYNLSWGVKQMKGCCSNLSWGVEQSEHLWLWLVIVVFVWLWLVHHAAVICYLCSRCSWILMISCCVLEFFLDLDQQWWFLTGCSSMSFFCFDFLVDASWSWLAMLNFAFLLAGYSPKSWDDTYKHVSLSLLSLCLKRIFILEFMHSISHC